MKVSKEAKVGLLTVLALVILYFGFSYLKGINFFNPSNTYYVLYDNVGGLEVSNPVEINGYRIGRVSEISLLQEGALTRMLVSLEITDDLALYQGSEAILRDSDFLGSKVIDLKVKEQGKLLNDEDTLSGYVEKTFTGMLKEKADPIMQKVDTTLKNVNDVLGTLSGSGGEIELTIVELKETSRMLRAMVTENRRDINAITHNIKGFTEAINDPQTGLKPFLSKLNQLADTLNNGELNATLASTRQTMERLELISKNLEAGKGSLGKLLADDSLYQALTQSSTDLDKLLIDIQEHPERYIDLRFSLINLGGGK